MSALSTMAFVLIVIATMVILVFRDWRFNAAALAIQYLAAFVLVSLSWPMGMAVVKLIVGWMATSAITLTCMRHTHTESDSETTASLFFRGLAGLLIVLLIFILSPALQQRVFPRVDLVIIQGGMMMVGMSLMQLGTNSEPYLVIMSLLTFLCGFEVIHAALELSTLLTGLLVVVNLGLALVGVYFTIKISEPSPIEDEGEPS